MDDPPHPAPIATGAGCRNAALYRPRHIRQQVVQHHPRHRVIVQVPAELEGRNQQPAGGDLPFGHQRDRVVQPAHEQPGVDIALELGGGNAGDHWHKGGRI